ncbi:MAG: alanine--glyoxylate aminotransferase family protein, partial [Gammaproteobacteria bacterium]
NSICIPEGVDDAAVRARLLADYSLEIGAGLGSLAGKVWRIGLMGYTSNPKNVAYCLDALENILRDMNAPIHSRHALPRSNKRSLDEA